MTCFPDEVKWNNKEFTKEMLDYLRAVYCVHPMVLDALDYINSLESRIAELEAEVAELKPYRDGYDPKKVFPPEAEWVWMRDCDDNIEPVQYNHIAEIYWNYMPGDCDELYCYWHPNDGDLRRWYPIGKLPEESER